MALSVKDDVTIPGKTLYLFDSWHGNPLILSIYLPFTLACVKFTGV